MVHWSRPDIGEEECNAVQEAMREKWISGFGPRIKEFEKEFARKVKARYAIATSNGTVACLAQLLAVRHILSRGKPTLLIKVPTWTFFATVATADLVGEVALMDAEMQTFNMTPSYGFWSDVVVPVDVGGMPTDYDSYIKSRESHKMIMADSCQALGSMYKGRPVGGIADVHAFSLYSSKIITTGEGGMITTNRPYLASVIRKIVNQGYEGTTYNYKHSLKGFNFRMPELQAAMGLVQLEKLDKYVSHHRHIASIYKEVIGDKVLYQYEPDDCKSNYYAFTIILSSPKMRNELALFLIKHNIEYRLWRPVHYQPPFFSIDKKFPIADFLTDHHIQLPIHNCMTEEEALYVAQTINKYMRIQTCL